MTIGTGPKGLVQAAAKKIAALARKKFTKAGGCSFDGSMEVLTEEGYVSIVELPIGKTTVFAMDELTGEYHLRPVLRHLWNAYEHTVYIDILDTQSNVRQTIVSNKIHPFFVKRAGYIPPKMMPVGSRAEQNVYVGPIEDGHWIQAADLQLGDMLLSSDGDWVEVTGLRVTEESLVAYNLDVAVNDNFFVRGAGAEDSDGVWVHNCDGTNSVLPEAASSIDSKKIKEIEKRVLAGETSFPLDTGAQVRAVAESFRDNIKSQLDAGNFEKARRFQDSFQEAVGRLPRFEAVTPEARQQLRNIIDSAFD